MVFRTSMTPLAVPIPGNSRRHKPGGVYAIGTAHATGQERHQRHDALQRVQAVSIPPASVRRVHRAGWPRWHRDRRRCTMEGARSMGRTWAGRVLSALAVVFLLFDSVVKLLGIAPVLDSFGRLGYPAGVATGIGILELACVILYVTRPVAVPGAVLLTGFLGGAVASHVRVGDPL